MLQVIDLFDLIVFKFEIFKFCCFMCAISNHFQTDSLPKIISTGYVNVLSKFSVAFCRFLGAEKESEHHFVGAISFHIHIDINIFINAISSIFMFQISYHISTNFANFKYESFKSLTYMV